jgi:hypothetical protein
MVAVLMARRVVLHVGAMKSGTSYLQRLLMENRELLGERGVLLPGQSWRDQVRGVVDVLDRQGARRHRARAGRDAGGGKRVARPGA